MGDGGGQGALTELDPPPSPPQEFAGGDDADLVSRVRWATGRRRQEALDRCQLDQGRFSCIQHNDAWFNNFMYKYVGGLKKTPDPLPPLVM